MNVDNDDNWDKTIVPIFAIILLTFNGLLAGVLFGGRDGKYTIYIIGGVYFIQLIYIAYVFWKYK